MDLKPGLNPVSSDLLFLGLSKWGEKNVLLSAIAFREDWTPFVVVD